MSRESDNSSHFKLYSCFITLKALLLLQRINLVFQYGDKIDSLNSKSGVVAVFLENGGGVVSVAKQEFSYWVYYSRRKGNILLCLTSLAASFQIIVQSKSNLIIL